MKARIRRRRPGWLPLLLLHFIPAAVAGAGAASSPAAATAFLLPTTTRQPPPCRPRPRHLVAHASSLGDDDAPRYAARGVSAYKGEVLAAVGRGGDRISPSQQGQEQKQRPGSLPSLYPNAFCKLVPDVLTGSSEHALVSHADGAGTKAALAYTYWKETGDMRVWKGIAQDALTMNLDDVFCCGATGPALVTSTIGRNRRLVPGEVVSALIHGLEEACAELRPYGIDVGVAGGETADIGDLVRTVTLDCTYTTRVRRSEVVDNGRIGPGDWIVGLASADPDPGTDTGYESNAWLDGWNSGIGANGLTAARHDVLEHRMSRKFPESFDPGLPPHLVYSGGWGLTEPVPPEYGAPPGTTVGQLLLSPTRSYAPLLKALLADERALPRAQIHGLVHCSGGGQTKALRCLSPSGPPLRVVKDALFETPGVFRLIHAEQVRLQAAAPEALWREMYQVFNMGHRLEIYLADLSAVRTVVDAAWDHGIDAHVVGQVQEGPPGATGHSLVIRGQHGEFVYT